MTEPGVLHADRIWLSPDVFLNSSRGVEAPPAAQFENSPSRQGEINRKAKHRFEALGRVSGAAFSPDGTSVLTFGQELALWDVARGSKVHIYHGRERAMSAAFSSDGNSILTGGADGTIEAWSKDDTDHGRTFPTHRGAVIAVGFSVGPERLIVSAAEDRTVRAWTASGEEVRSCIARDRSPADPATVSAAAFSADGRFALYCGADGTLTLWGLGQPPEAEAFAPADGPVTDISPFPGGQIVLAREPAGAAVWDLATRRKLHPTGWPAGRVEGATVSPDSRWLAAVRGERLTLWDARTLAAPRDVAVKRKAHQPAPLAFSPDGRLLLVPASGNAVAVIDADAGQELAQLRGHRDTVTCLAVSSDGRLALTGSRDKTARLWDISNPKAPREVSVLQGHADTINAVAFSPDGRGAVTAGGNSDYEAGQDDFVVRLWTITETGAATLSKSLAGHAKRVRAVALSTDGLLLASADDDGTIKLWDACTGDELRTLLGHTGPVLSLALIPGTYMLLSGSEDHSMRQWNLNAPLQRARLSVPFDAALRAMRDGAETTRPGPSSGPELLAACGLWYAWNGIDDWAADFLSRAGPSLTPDDQLTLARCYWSQGRLDDAETAFRAASGNSAETRPASGGYLQWCLESIIAEKTAGAAGSK